MVVSVRQEIQELNEGTHEGYRNELATYQRERNVALDEALIMYKYQLDTLALLYEQEKIELEDLHQVRVGHAVVVALFVFQV